MANGVFDISRTAGAAIATLAGTGAVTLGGQVLTLTSAASSFGGTLADGGLGGGLTVAGGAQMLTGASSYSGSTAVASGATLALAGAGSIARSSGVAVAGTLDISGGAGAAIATLSGAGRVTLGAQTLTLTNAGGSFGGVLAGTGGLAIGAGRQSLTAANAYTGTTTVGTGATLALAGAGSIAASSGVSVAGVLDVSGTAGTAITTLAGGGTVALGGQALTLTAASSSFGGSIADGGLRGRLVVAGGTQTLTGVNTYGGGTTVSGATLAVPADSALGAAGAALTLDNGTLQALANLTTTRPLTVTANGGTVNAGPYQVSLGGPLTLGGALTTFGAVQFSGATQSSGTITVGSGRLAVNATLGASALAIGQGGVLRGTGTINAPTTVSGTLAPGNSPGTLSFNAPVVLGSGAVAQFDIDGTGTGTGAGNYSRVVVNGASSFTAAGLLAPVLRGITGSATNSYTPALGQSFTVINAGGGVLGSFAGLTQPAGLASGTRLDALYAPSALTLVVTPAFYGNLAAAGLPQSANQQAVGTVLDSLRPAAGVRMLQPAGPLYTQLYLTAPAALPGTLDQLSPLIAGERLMVARDAWYTVSNAVSAEQTARRGAGGGGQSAPGPKDSTVWLSGLGQFTNVSSDAAAGYSASTGGVAAGVDTPLLPWLSAGVAVGFTNSAASDRNGARLAGDGLQLAAYGSLHQGIAFLDVQGGGGFWEGTTWRTVPALSLTTRGNDTGTTAGGSVRAGVHLALGGWAVEPSLSLGGASLHQNTTTESQGGAAALAIGGATVGSVQTVLGAQAQRRFGLGDGVALTPSARLGWLHEFADTSARTGAAFAGALGSPFVAQTARIGRDMALVGVGGTLETAGPLAVFASYTGAVNTRSTAQNLAGGIRLAW